MNDAIVLYAVVDMPHSLSPSKWLRGLLKTARVSFLVRWHRASAVFGGLLIRGYPKSSAAKASRCALRRKSHRPPRALSMWRATRS